MLWAAERDEAEERGTETERTLWYELGLTNFMGQMDNMQL